MKIGWLWLQFISDASRCRWRTELADIAAAPGLLGHLVKKTKIGTKDVRQQILKEVHVRSGQIITREKPAATSAAEKVIKVLQKTTVDSG